MSAGTLRRLPPHFNDVARWESVPPVTAPGPGWNMPRMKPWPWLADVLACPRCGGALAHAVSSREGSGVTRCRRCGPYPVLAGVPVLVPHPAEWCAAFRESALATLAEWGLARGDAVEVVDAFSDAAPATEPRRFGDDWTVHEAQGAAPETPVDGPAGRELAALLRTAQHEGPLEWLTARVPKDATVAEVGCGAGLLAQRVGQRARRQLVLDLSLRAVLAARERAERGERAEVLAVVADAEALPLRAGAVDLLVAEHLMDLLDDVPAFLEGARRAAKRVLLTTPEPRLAFTDDAALATLAEGAGFRVVEQADGLPWVRHGSARFLELYLVQALALERARTATAKPRSARRTAR